MADTKFLDRAMPIPMVVLCAFAVVTAEFQGFAAAAAAIFVTTNIAMNEVKRRLHGGRELGLLIDRGRGVVSLLCLPVLAWAAGPETPAWVVALPPLIAIPFLQRRRGATLILATLVTLVLLGWTRFTPSVSMVLGPLLGMLALGGVSVPVASAMRLREQHLLATLTELQEATEVAGQASRAKSDFLAKMSHELRTPLGAITGYAELLLDSPKHTQAVQDAPRVIKRNAEHLVQLVNQVLDLAKIEADELLVDAEPVRVLAVVEDVAVLMRGKAERAVDFSVQYDSRMPVAFSTDALRLKQILINLVGNAFKFTPAGTVRLRVGIIENELRFEVIDTGIGISPDKIASIFQPFRQADASTSRLYGGTGLGLPISRELAGLLGGRLEVQSVAGEGSTFALVLPFSPEGAELEDTSITYPGAAAQGDLDLDVVGMRALLAEDFRDSGRLIELHLNHRGITTVWVEDGQQAVDAVAKAAEDGSPFDVVLMDMQMPVLDGYTATAQLRESGVTTPIIGLTAHAMVGDRERCLRAGCDAYLPKPVDFDALITRMAELCPAPPGGRAPPSESTDKADAAAKVAAIVAGFAKGFVAQLPSRLASVQEAWDAGDTAAVTPIVHRLAGSAGMYGFAACGDAARAVEQSIDMGVDDEQIGAAIAALAEEIAAVVANERERERSTG